MKYPQTISVGIVANTSIYFSLNTPYLINGKTLEGKIKATFTNNNIEIITENGQSFQTSEFYAKADQGTFTVEEVVIGVDFHWESKEKQTFEGDLKIITTNTQLQLINILDIDKYLCSVISSEMSATSSKELLKAHAVMSRSWLLAQLVKRNEVAPTHYNSCQETPSERVKWYDREDHNIFDVCADDHCQRYQGITRIISPLVKEAIDTTKGLILSHNGKVCDARFSKSCGGVSEQFENCWEPTKHNYLKSVVDHEGVGEVFSLDLRQEEQAKQWILDTPKTFCNVEDKAILKQVLNDYDQETADFYRWTVNYTQEEIKSLLASRVDIEIGDILELNALERGLSGRITRLQIVGTEHTFTIGKELEIRKALSNSHLYSSAFVVEYKEINNDIPQQFIIRGAGWGHGVGLCQIGAAVMADKGYDYKQILWHYFRDSVISQM